MTYEEAVEKIKWIMQNKSHTKELCDICIEALEKQIPKKPIVKTHKYIGSDDDFTDKYYCPVCNALIINEDTNGFYAGRKQKHCDCGQALDWSDTE